MQRSRHRVRRARAAPPRASARAHAQYLSARSIFPGAAAPGMRQTGSWSGENEVGVRACLALRAGECICVRPCGETRMMIRA